MPRSVSSASYLHKHRRSPSSSKTISFTAGHPTPDTSPLNDNSSEDMTCQRKADGYSPNTSGQHPANITGSVVSPPDSNLNSSDDDEDSKRGRVRSLENLAELQAAIRTIEQHRMSSPNGLSEETKEVMSRLGHNVPRLKISAKEQTEQATFSPRQPLSEGARKISHSRSSTDGSVSLDFARNKFDSPSRSTSGSDIDEGDDNDLPVKPPMVRKKSGELVRPALRAPSLKRRPSSMPGTPTYGKAVHFDSRLEHVRHFLQVDRPVAVSAGTSPVDSQDDDSEFPFSQETRPFEWEIRLTNFPCETLERKSAPVKVERVFLSADNKNLMGAVVVRNVAFHKFVVARFTLDYWKTTSEVVADYNNDVRRKKTDGYDPFLFSIKLEDQANLENKTLFFCVRYNVNGQEYWDNNNSINYRVEFSKKGLSQNTKQGSTENVQLRSKPVASLPSGRPRSMPISADDFSFGLGSQPGYFSFPQPSVQVIGDSPIRFRNSKASSDIVPDHPDLRTNPASQAFGNRYDFGASLSAAINAAGSTLGDRSGIPTREEVNSSSTKLNPAKEGTVHTAGKSNTRSGAEMPAKSAETTKSDTSKPVALIAEKPPMQSSSYSELINKYCFVRTRTDKGGQAVVR